MANKGRARIVALAGLLCAAFGGLGAQAQDLSFELIGGGAVGDDGPATFANLIGIGDLVFDGAGNLYIAEFRGNRIRKVSPAGTATTLVGGATGFGGDGGPASAARISHPRNMAFDAGGNLYFSDAGNHRVRRIATDGTITTVAGNGGFVHAGDGGQALDAGIADPGGLAFDSAGNLYIADTTSHRVRKVTPSGVISTYAGTGVKGYVGDGGQATAAAFDQPMGIDVDADDNLYIADTNNSAIRKVAPDGSITTFLVSANSYPMGVEVGADGAVYSADIAACAVYKTPPGSATELVAGGGGCDYNGENVLSFSASVGEVEGIALDGAGNVYMADSTHDMVRRLTVSTNLVDTFAGNLADIVAGSPAIGAPLGMGLGIAVNGTGDIAFSDTWPRLRVMKIDSAGKIRRLAGNGLYDNVCGPPCGNALSFSFLYPWGTAFSPDGKVYISDRGWNRIYRIEADGSLVVVAGASTSLVNDGQPATTAKVDPNGIAFDAAGNLYTAELQYHRVRKIDTAGIISTIAGVGTAGFSGDGGPGTSASVNAPNGIAVAADGTVYFNDNNNRRIRKIATNGTITTIAGNGGTGLSGDGGPAVDAETGVVYGMAVDASGVYLAATGRIRRIAPDGTIDSIGGWSDYAMGLAIRDGKLYVTTQNGRVMRAALPASSTHRTAHDYDGDGKSDVLWREGSTGANVVWRTANFATPQSVIGVTNTQWKVVGQGDFDGDGKTDMMWRLAATGENVIWRSANNATQIPVTRVSSLWSVAGIGDFDADGKSDILWRHATTGQNVIWRSANSAQQLPATGVTNLAWKVVGIGDFDNDGASDVLWRNTGNGVNAIWRSANAATQITVTAVTNQAWKVVGVGDFDGDGKSDILWRHGTSGQNVMWAQGNYAMQQQVTGVTNTTWKVAQVGDYDGDGRSDIFWRNTASGTNAIWKSANSATTQTVAAVTNVAWSAVPYENQP